MLGELFEKLIKDATFHRVAHFTLMSQHNVPKKLQKYQALHYNHLQLLIFVMSDGKDEIKLSKPLTQLATRQISRSHGPHLKERGNKFHSIITCANTCFHKIPLTGG